jgi:hypothetical protein
MKLAIIIMIFIQTGSGAHPASYSVIIGVLSTGYKRAGRVVDHTLPSIAEVYN